MFVKIAELFSKFFSLPESLQSVELILGNSNPKFSGVTSTMLQTSRYQQQQIRLAVLGKHHLDSCYQSVSFWQCILMCYQPLPSGHWRVFHARRNDEMIQALILKFVFAAKIKILFTSTAQRHHSGFTRFLMHKMDAVISTCSYAASYLTFEPDAIVPHGVNTQTYCPVINQPELKAELNLPQDKLIGIFGRVREQKGVHHLVRTCIQLFPKLNGYSCIICGAWDDEALVKQLKLEVEAAGLEQRIIFLGEQAFSDLPKLFQVCSIVTALSDNEGFGLTVLEAMSCGCTVVATKAGAWPDIIRDGQDGLLIDVNSPEQTYAALDTLVHQPEKLKEMGKHARQRVLSHYQIEQEASSLVNIYRKLQKNSLADLASNTE